MYDVGKESKKTEVSAVRIELISQREIAARTSFSTWQKGNKLSRV